MSRSVLGARLPHESALGHVSGEARYVDDLPLHPGTLHGMILHSPHAHARIVRRDATRALQVPGVHGVVFARDIPGENNVGPVFHDEPMLAEDEVHCVGQAVAVVFAESPEAGREALARIEVEYEPLPALVDFDQAIEAESFFGAPHVVTRGEPDTALKNAPHQLSGTVRSGGQEHFYLETHCAMALVDEARTIRVFSSTQHPSEVQALVGATLGWGRHRVTVVCPRMGGAFGGKETQAAQFGCMAALGATLTGRPVKVWLDRDTDMATTGRRHPFRTDWQAGFDDEGNLLGFTADLYNDAGWASDLSLSILDRGVFHVDNAYFLPDCRVRGFAVRTHKISNTAFRGFGGPQGMVVIEHVLERIAAHLGLDPVEVRRRNFYAEGRSVTHYGQDIGENRLPRILDELTESAGLARRRAEVAAFNASHPFTKRGIALVPVRFGISFTASFLNQAGAYVLLYADGSVQLNHGGTEMGQGLYTKMIQVCAHAMGVPPSRVRAMATATDKVPNTSATAASSGADLNGAAIQDACEQMVARLRPVAAELLEVEADALQLAAGFAGDYPDIDGEPAWAWVPGGEAVTLSQVAGAAYMRQIQLSAAGFYRTPDIAYDRDAGHGKPFHYFAYGAAISEVEVNGHTGQWQLRRVDILHDVGDSLSADIDRGQVEGGFIQGLGWLTIEELVFDEAGKLLTHSPSTYKIPAIGEAPVDFRVELLDRATQHDVVYGSKAVGEPPFLLAVSAHVAIERAARAFTDRSDLIVPIPATNEAILLAIHDAG